MSDVLPEGLSIVEDEEETEPGVIKKTPQVGFFTMPLGNDFGPESFLGGFFKMCSTTSVSVSCTLTQKVLEGFEGSLPGAKELKPFESFEIKMKVKNTGPVATRNSVEVSGGGGRVARVKRPVSVSALAPVFGTEEFSMVPEEEGGEPDVQAGSHPFQFTTSFALNQNALSHSPPALPRNFSFQLPAGLVGNATAGAQCTDQQFEAIVSGGTGNRCPQDTAVGVVSVNVESLLEPLEFAVPLYNLTPEVGEPARFGFEFAHAPVTLDTSVRTGSDYGVTATVSNTTEIVNFISTKVTIWGVPGDSRHDSARGWGCLRGGLLAPGLFPCERTSAVQPPPFLTMPTSCKLPFTASVEGVSWPNVANPSGAPLASAEHGTYTLNDEFERPLSVSGCNDLSFSPSIAVQPDVQSASTPTGVSVQVKVPQEVAQNPLGLSSSSVRDIVVRFPEGVTVNPAAADGLEACSEAEVGFTGFHEFNPAGEPGLATALFTPTVPSPFCPDASKIGTVKIKVPLISHPIEGALYLATQDANPFKSLIASYIVAEDPFSGILLKLPGEVSLDPNGRVTATFKNNPQAPLEEAEIHLFGGSRAPFTTPSRCRENTPEYPGLYTTDATFTPWSGTEPAHSSSSFEIKSGPGGGPCPGPALPFAPSLDAGVTNINAAAFSTLNTTISRPDGNQDIQTVQLHMPPGLSGILAGVPLCPEAQANAGTCAQQSLIGHTIVSVGLGNEPFSVTGGEVFLTEGYKGAQFGLSIVNPAKAGPFDLGKVIVRASIQVDPTTAELTIATGQIPHILKGIPLQIKHVNVTIDRPGFTFNPTNCSKLAVTGVIGSAEGASSPVGVPFQVTNCAALKFAPKFNVSTSGKTSRANGASLTAKLSYPKAPHGTQANITRVKVDLPKQLPSRLTTLQKACTNAQFAANPAGCPAASKIGMATVTTPLLPVPLSGPAIFVSHGGEAFPSLTMVLQGYGVTVDLVGTTFISKKGITSTTFKTVPDVPFNMFQLTLPQGKFSALAANGNLCKSKLVMPTEFLAQNGAVIHQTTKISVTGCAKHKVKRAKRRGRHPAGRRKPGRR
ncbi:MAG TPA: hypothetical protein VGG98_08675 [Solirubrobacteraceae bacterium]